jgi:ABC-type uncharacterized transport system fused permease/ATPase subunit
MCQAVLTPCVLATLSPIGRCTCIQQIEDKACDHDGVLCTRLQSKLALEWRQWMTERLTLEYFEDRTFYRVQAGGLLDNPDQRIASDIRQVIV